MGEDFTANIATERFFSGVSDHMDLDRLRVGKSLVANLAGERFVTSVHVSVVLQGAGVVEEAVTHLALEGLLVCGGWLLERCNKQCHQYNMFE